MKNMKKLFAMALAVMMVLTLATTAFAAGPYTLTLTGAQAGHTYTAYQIFTGDLNDSTLSNITWGSGVTDAGKAVLVLKDELDALTSVAAAEAFAAKVAPYLGTAAGSSTIATDATTGTISGLEAGYYLIQTTATTDKNGVKTYYLMKVVKDTTATIKADVPEVEKTVNDNDANIGDTVTFTLTATMPNTFEGYDSYKVVFHDTMYKGLTYNNDATVNVSGFTVTSGTDGDGNTTLTITNKNVLADDVTPKVTANSTITVTYTATLNSDAIIGTEGNFNKVYLEYSNDPNWNGEGTEPTGKTPEDEVKVYTWKIPVFKYTKEGDPATEKPLAGAGFTLYTDALCTNAVSVVPAGSNVYKVCTKDDSTDSHKHQTEIVTDGTGEFEIEGLEERTYYLKETTVPAGFNSVANVTVVINNDGTLTIDGDTVVTVSVLNQAGSTLPETGGVGTTLFYLFGGVMVAAAAVLLVTKKRMAA